MEHQLKSIALVVLSLICPAEVIAQTSLVDLEGTFEYAGGQKQRARLEEAVESVVGEMNVLYRVIARSRLKAAATIERSFTFKINSDGNVSIKAGSNVFRTTKTDGTPIWYTNEKGEKIRLLRTWRKGVLTTIGNRGDASQRNVYRLSPDGKMLSVTITISSEQLPRPLVYHLTYRRRSASVTLRRTSALEPRYRT